MEHIRPLTVDDENYESVLADADQIVKDYASFGHVIMNKEFSHTVLLALVTWKKIAEERQEHLDASNEDWFNKGLAEMMRPYGDIDNIKKRIEERKLARAEKQKEYERRCAELKKEMGL